MLIWHFQFYILTFSLWNVMNCKMSVVYFSLYFKKLVLCDTFTFAGLLYFIIHPR